MPQIMQVHSQPAKEVQQQDEVVGQVHISTRGCCVDLSILYITLLCDSLSSLESPNDDDNSRPYNILSLICVCKNPTPLAQ